MKRLLTILALLLVTAQVSAAASYNYISAEQVKNKLTAGEEMLIVDIQVAAEFAEHHLPGAVATYAYPVKTVAEKEALDQAVTRYQESGDQVVIVCPRGEGGAKRTYDYLITRNVPEDKLVILEKGMAGWPYPEMVEKE